MDMPLHLTRKNYIIIKHKKQKIHLLQLKIKIDTWRNIISFVEVTERLKIWIQSDLKLNLSLLRHFQLISTGNYITESDTRAKWYSSDIKKASYLNIFKKAKRIEKQKKFNLTNNGLNTKCRWYCVCNIERDLL